MTNEWIRHGHDAGSLAAVRLHAQCPNFLKAKLVADPSGRDVKGSITSPIVGHTFSATTLSASIFHA